MTRRRCFVEEKTKEKRSSVHHAQGRKCTSSRGQKCPRGQKHARRSESEKPMANFRAAYLGNPNPSGSSLELLLPFFAIARMMTTMLFSGRRRRVRIIVVASWRLQSLHLSGTTQPSLLADDVNDDGDFESLADAGTMTRMVVVVVVVVVVSRRTKPLSLSLPPPPPLRSKGRRATKRLWCPFLQGVGSKNAPSLFFSL